MKVLLAAEDSGSLKIADFPRGTDTSKRDSLEPSSINTYHEKGRKDCIDLVRVTEYKGNRLAIAARRNGSVEIYDLNTDDLALVHSWSEPNQKEEAEEDKFVGLEHCGEYLVACTEKGVVKRFNLENHEAADVHIDNKAGKKLSFFKRYSKSSVFAIGGKDWDVQLIELKWDDKEKINTVFKGKNVKNDRLDMTVPIWPTGIVFLGSHEKFVITTHYGQIRLYDTKRGRRPYESVKVAEHPISAFASGGDSDTIVFSDNHTTTALFSLKDMKSLGKFQGATGAVQDIHAFNNSILATGGLDRYLRTFDIKTRETLGKVFIGTQISAVWVLEDDTSQDVKRKMNEDEVEEEEMWQELEKGSKKKKKRTE
ncbi:ribosome biogenesis protein Nsa1p [Trichomonascus vanleenenianus]|uniref:ribosome biosynthesis protein NSA1 n=1 Tax=Trichomonascus vanleenenianus TaxID=2268995 RepID=UPI003EC99723